MQHGMFLCRELLGLSLEILCVAGKVISFSPSGEAVSISASFKI